MMLSARNRSGIEAVPTTLSGVRQMIKALRKGQAVGLLPEPGATRRPRPVGTLLANRPTTMTLAARLALQTGATGGAVAGCERLSWGRGFAPVF